MKRIIHLFIYSFALISCLHAQTKQVIRTFPLSDVRLLESPFYSAQELDEKYLLELDADRLLAPFRREAGLSPKAPSYTNWENSGLDGHIGGHYLSALALMYSSTGDVEIKRRLDYFLDELKHCQDANGDGYIGGVPGGKAIWAEIARGDIRANSFDLNGKWVPLYNIHKTFAGLRDAWLYADDSRARDMLVKMADWAIWLVSGLNDEQMQDMLRSEHGGLNETFADVAAITGDPKYLELARKFSHHLILDPLLTHEDKLTGLHANTQIPKVIGYKRIADLEGNKDWSDAARFFWNTVVKNRSVAIGGNSVREHFHPTDDFSRMIRSEQGPETCNTYNMLRLTKMFYETSADKAYMEYYEKALYNHILSTQHPGTGGLVYFTQMRPGHYRVYSQPHTSMWCCVGSGIENHAKYGEMIYAHTNDELFVNLFIPSLLEWKEKGITVVQENRFPDEASTTLTVSVRGSRTFTLLIRYPDWVPLEKMRIRVNDKFVEVQRNANGYVAIRRTWRKNDKVEVDLPMEVSVEQLPDRSDYYAFFYGPIVLAAETTAEEMPGLYADDSRGGHIAQGHQIPFKELPILASNPENLAANLARISGKDLSFGISNLYPANKWNNLTLIPFYRLHDSRYILYWPQASPEQVKALQEMTEIRERERERLQARTIDQVNCGEQQPESDHFIESKGSSTGAVEDVHWREASGWFSYRLSNKNVSSRFLYIFYFDRDVDRYTDIYLNGVKVDSVLLSGKGGEQPVSRLIAIPPSLSTEKELMVLFGSNGNKKTFKLVEIRLLRDTITQI